MKNKVAILSPMHPQTIVERLERDFDLCHLWQADDPAEHARDNAHDAQALVTNSHYGAPAWIYEFMPKLRIIGNFGVGYDGVDVQQAAKHGVWVSNTPDVLTDDVADWAVALMLAGTRQLVAADRYVRDGRWSKQGAFQLTGRLNSQRVGLIGFGRIGQAIAKRLEAFSCTIGYSDLRQLDDVSYRYFSTAAQLADWAQIACVALPGGQATNNLVDADVLAALGPQGWLVNVGRGSTVDEMALVAALADGTIAGASLDVYADEPNVPQQLLDMPNVVLTPHQASATVHTREAMGFLVADNIKQVLAGGRPITPVNEPV